MNLSIAPRYLTSTTGFIAAVSQLGREGKFSHRVVVWRMHTWLVRAGAKERCVRDLTASPLQLVHRILITVPNGCLPHSPTRMANPCLCVPVP